MTEKINLIKKEGDQGTTSLFSGERVSKAELRIEALGAIDELQSSLGIARCHAQTQRAKNELLEIQQRLFKVGSFLATIDEALTPSPLETPIDQEFLDQLENKTQSIQDSVEIPEHFIIPGDNLAAAYINQTRTFARRVERCAVRLKEQDDIDNPYLMSWLNRLSVYLFLMSLYEQQHA